MLQKYWNIIFKLICRIFNTKSQLWFQNLSYVFMTTSSLSKPDQFQYPGILIEDHQTVYSEHLHLSAKVLVAGVWPRPPWKAPPTSRNELAVYPAWIGTSNPLCWCWCRWAQLPIVSKRDRPLIPGSTTYHWRRSKVCLENYRGSNEQNISKNIFFYIKLCISLWSSRIETSIDV